MTAAPCPTLDALERDPNLCAVCGHWCGRKCEREREWNPRFVAYAVLAHRTYDCEAVLVADRERFGGGRMTGFVLWLRGKVDEWRQHRYRECRESFDTPLDHAAFDVWLAKQVQEAR